MSRPGRAKSAGQGGAQAPAVACRGLAGVALLMVGATSALAAEPQASLAGTWLVSTEVEPQFFSTSVLHLDLGTGGELRGTLDLLARAEYGLPLEGARLRGTRLQLQTEHACFQGELGADGEVLGTVQRRGMGDRLFAWAFGETSEHPFRMRRTAAERLPLRPESRTYERDGHEVHYMAVAASAAARVVFIHGSPGEWSDFGTFLVDRDLQLRATLLAVDRPGFGASAPGQVVPDLHEQARLLEPLLQAGPAAGTGDPRAPAARAPSRRVPTVVVGWSEGGPIAAELAMDYPDEVQQAVLVAPAIDPDHDGAQWYNRAVTHWPLGGLVSWALGPEMLWSNREIMRLGPQLTRMERRWGTLTVPVTVIQGSVDGLVDPRTADFAARVLPPSGRVIRVAGAGHVSGWGKTLRDVLMGVLEGPGEARPR